jgi:hypothetical protein
MSVRFDLVDKDLHPLSDLPDWIRCHIVRDACGRRIFMLTKYDLMAFDRDHVLLSITQQFLMVSRIYIHEIWVEQFKHTPLMIKRFLKDNTGRGAPIAVGRWQVNPVNLSSVAARDFEWVKSELAKAEAGKK